MSNPRGPIGRALNMFGLAEIAEPMISPAYRNGVGKSELKKLQIGGMAVATSNVGLARFFNLNESRDPYDSATTVFVDSVDFRDVLSGCRGAIPENYVGLVIRNKKLAGSVVKFTLSAEVPQSIYLGINDTTKIESVRFTDQLDFAASEPFVTHKSAEPVPLHPDFEILIPTPDLVGQAFEALNGIANASSQNTCGIDNHGIVIESLT